MARLSKSDSRLLRSAKRELEARSRVRLETSRSTSERSIVFTAKWAAHCNRCLKPITKGQDIRFVDGYQGAVHDHCRPPSTTPRTRKPRATPPSVCPDCHLEHGGPCW